MGIETGTSGGTQEENMGREKLIKAKIDGITGNAGETRSNEEITKQAIHEVSTGISVEVSEVLERPSAMKIQQRAITTIERVGPEMMVSVRNDIHKMAEGGEELKEYYPGYTVEDFEQLAKKMDEIIEKM